MHIKSTTTALAAMAMMATTNAHTVFTNLFVDGQNQGDGVCVRMDMDGARCTHPINGLQSPEMACGRNGETGVDRVCPAKSGSTLTFEFRIHVDGSKPGAIDRPHYGPCAVYMKKVDSATESNNAAGDGWFKIWHEDYDEDEGKWCTDKMIDNDGHISATIPSDLQGGYYLVRPEILALHFASNDPPDPQFYVNCAQLYVESSGSAQPETVSIPENYVDLSMPAMTFNVYDKPMALPYPMYGPEPYESSGSSSDDVAIDGTGSDYGTEDECMGDDMDGDIEGLKPEGCIMVNANWCGFEVPSYSDPDGCWSSSSDCWEQNQACFDEAPPTGVANCKLWSKKCYALDDSCDNGNYNGPPDADKDLTPDPPSLNSRKLMALMKRQGTHLMKRVLRASDEK